jgi:hypothetical protein
MLSSTQILLVLSMTAQLCVAFQVAMSFSQCPVDPMVMENWRTEKIEELRLLYYLRIYGDTPPQSTVY